MIVQHGFLISWLMFGFIAFMAVYSGSRPWVNHRKWVIVFALALIIAGPLALLLALVPAPTVQRWAQTGRDWLDRHD